MDQSLALFQKRDDLDELEGFQQQELAKVKHMVSVDPPKFKHQSIWVLSTSDCGLCVDQLLKKEEQLSQQELQLQQKEADLQAAERNLSEVRGNLQLLKQHQEESSRLNDELEIERWGPGRKALWKDETRWFSLRYKFILPTVSPGRGGGWETPSNYSCSHHMCYNFISGILLAMSS